MYTSMSGCFRVLDNSIAERLALLGLDEPGASRMSEELQERVIRPQIDSIASTYFELLDGIEEFNSIVAMHSDPGALKATQKSYLLKLGVDFQHPDYFDERVRIGRVHQKIGVPLPLYQCALQKLQGLLIEAVPTEIREDGPAFEEMIHFILRITVLDMSLASESYCNATVIGLQDSLDSQRGESERLRKLATTDWLTDLHNHSHTRKCLGDALDYAQAEGLPLCVIMADLDHFKKINDSHSHLVGDRVLRIAAARMLSGARTNDHVGRYGGEEFLFILQNTAIVEAGEVAERVRTRVNNDLVQCGDTSLTVTVSLGVAEARDNDTVDEVIARADAALYVAKAEGRDCIRSSAKPAGFAGLQ